MSRGQPKTGGRQKGAKNKRTQEMAEIIEAAAPGFDPVAWLAVVAHTGQMPDGEPVSPDLRIQCAKYIAPYVHPQKKAVDHNLHASLAHTFHVTALDVDI